MNILKPNQSWNKSCLEDNTFSMDFWECTFYAGFLFLTFGPCVKGFKLCRPIIQIDRTHLYGKYKGKLLIATSIDTNGHIFPLAFSIVEEKSQDSWSWFLTALRHHCTQREGICLIQIVMLE